MSNYEENYPSQNQQSSWKIFINLKPPIVSATTLSFYIFATCTMSMRCFIMFIKLYYIIVHNIEVHMSYSNYYCFVWDFFVQILNRKLLSNETYI